MDDIRNLITIINIILKDKNERIFNVEKMWGIGTPEDLESFLSEYDGFI